MGAPPPPTALSRHAELGAFLRMHRERTTPERVGLPPAGRRRTPGLRREEVAALAGVGLSWYTWLEQGREVTPSASVLDALARVFDLSSAERAHLFHLSGVAVPTPDGPYPTEAPADLAALVAALDPNPAFLLGPRSDVLAWNPAAARLLGTPAAAPDGVPNMLWWAFTEERPASPTFEETARSVLARFRAEHARRHDDPRFGGLVAALLDASPRFGELWRRHEVLTAQSGRKTMEAPDGGRLELLHLQSTPTNAPDLRLTQYAPADAATRVRLARLAAGEAPASDGIRG